MALSGFPGFDALGGGFVDGRSYLVHGPIGSGKSIFALQFLIAGLRRGESVALVTRAPVPVVLDKARAFGFDLEGFARGGRLALFDYAPRLVESCASLEDEREVVEELRAELRGPITRLVLDPVTPLLAGTSDGGAAFRARTLANGFTLLRSTTLLLCDTPEANDAVAAFRDVVYGTVRLEPTEGGTGRLVPEQLPGQRPVPIAFELKPGLGLEAATREAVAAGAPARRRVLVVVPFAPERARIAGLLAREHEVVEAQDAAAGLAEMAAAAPDLVVIERDSGWVEAVEFCRKLRASGVNVPIVLLATHLRRVRDRVALLAAGADECLERPLDPRLLRLTVRRLLDRYDSRRDRIAAGRGEMPAPIIEGGAPTFTSEAEEFVSRALRLASASRAIGVPFGVIAVRPAPGEDFLSARLHIERLVRDYDLVYVDDAIGFVLLAEADAAGIQVFSDRLMLSVSGQRPPQTAFRCFDPADPDLLSATEQWIRERLLAAEQTSERSPERRVSTA